MPHRAPPRVHSPGTPPLPSLSSSYIIGNHICLVGLPFKSVGFFFFFFCIPFLSLSTRVVHALFKGGDAFKFDNYMGITVGPILAKLFAMILDKRLNEWAKQHGLRAKGQAGFRKDYRTTYQLFILRTLIEQR